MNFLRFTLFATVFLLINSFSAVSQPSLQNDYSYSMEIPSVVAMESSAAHLYVLSESEGMAVFRTHRDSLQWLYTAPGMQQRGDMLKADIRFAYLFGDSNRLTVLEPTSTLGAYSATTLANTPIDAIRVDDKLYVILESGSLQTLNLQSPETLDSPAKKIDAPALKGTNFIDLAASSDKLFALSQNHQLFSFNKNENNISFHESTDLNQKIIAVFYIRDSLMGTTNDGTIFEISADGSLSKLGSIGEPVKDIKSWNNWLLIKGNSNRIWTSYQLTKPTLWKKNRDAGNYIAISKGQLWLSEYDRITKVTEVQKQENISAQVIDDASSPEIEPIPDLVIPYPNSLLIPLKLKGNYPVQNVQFSLQADVEAAEVRGQSLYWQPQSGDVGEHSFKVIASAPGGESSSTSFTVDVRSFNAPPRFTPLRTISIPLGRPFELPIKAIDPDGINKNLIRYLGVNLPEGSTINEQTGDFNWTPTDRQLGENTFRIIATDQYGAASSADVTIKVIRTGTGDN